MDSQVFTRASLRSSQEKSITFLVACWHSLACICVTPIFTSKVLWSSLSSNLPLPPFKKILGIPGRAHLENSV